MIELAPMVISARDEERLAGVHPDLVRVVREALPRLRHRVRVLEGVRTLARQAQLYAQGRTKPGKIVTDTMNSRHMKGLDGFGKAVDLAPVDEHGVIDWNDTVKFTGVALAMLSAAAELGIPIRSGIDWDRDGKFREHGEWDSPHYELLRSEYP